MYKVYQIELGDTIDTISQKSGAPINQLKELNGEFNVIPGNYIVIPNNDEQIFEMYKVKSGDNMYSLSKKFNIDLDDLLALNGLNKNDYIYPNQDLLVPTGNVDIYITKTGDTIEKILKNTGVTDSELLEKNEKIYLAPDQLLIFEKK